MFLGWGMHGPLEGDPAWQRGINGVPWWAGAYIAGGHAFLRRWACVNWGEVGMHGREHMCMN